MLICLIFFFIYKTRQFEVRHQSALIADENSNFGTGVFISYNHNNAAEAHHIKELLQKEGIIDYSRGKIEILDIDRLKLNACECYSLIENEFAEMIEPRKELAMSGTRQTARV